MQNHIDNRWVSTNQSPLTVGDFHLRPLSKLTAIFACHVDTGGSEDEGVFLRQVVEELQQRGIRVRKMMPGKLHRHRPRDGEILTRKLMLSDLQIPESLQLQERGLGRIARSWAWASSCRTRA